MDTDNTLKDAVERAGEIANAFTSSLSSKALPSKESLIGKTLDGRYLIKKELGRGGIGAVYLASDKKLASKLVVVKVLLEELLHNEWVVSKFRQEIEALSRIDDPGVVGIIDTAELPDGKPYIVMQFVEGVTLRSVLNPGGMNLERTANIVEQAGRALTAVHEKGILHRDLKPENIMLQTLNDGEEQVKIIDFGISKITNSILGPATVTGAMIAGTLAYMSPEQLSAMSASVSSDTYALGLITYEMVTGCRPFNPESVFQLLEMQREGVKVKPKDLRPSLPEAAQAVILKALSFDPHERYQRTKDFGKELARALIADARLLESPTRAFPTVKDHADLLSDRSVPYEIQAEKIDVPGSDRDVSGGPPAKDKSLTRVLIFMLAAAILIVVSVNLSLWSFRSSGEAKLQNSSPSNITPPPAVEHTIAYSFLVQKYRNGRPFEKPFPLSGEINFEKDYRVRLFLTSSQQGYLYLINEGPVLRNGMTEFNVLFPGSESPSTLQANQPIQIPPPSNHPDQDWVTFDNEVGAEKLWIVWSQQPVAELEAVKRWANPKDEGEIKDRGQINALREFFAKSSTSAREVKKNEEGTQTRVSGTGDILVYPLKLQHH